MPRAGAIAVVSMAFDPSHAYWEAAFALADALDKSDPGRAELAPVRTRLNLLTSATGARLEADLWPHLKGLTAGVYGEPSRPGRPTAGLLALHVDSDSAALRLVSHTLPHLAKLVPRGQDTAFWRSGLSVLVAWGDGVATNARAAAADTKLSVAPCCTDWQQAGKPAPERLGVFWPARCWPLHAEATAKSAACVPRSPRIRPPSGGAGPGKRRHLIPCDGRRFRFAFAGSSSKSHSKRHPNIERPVTRLQAFFPAQISVLAGRRRLAEQPIHRSIELRAAQTDLADDALGVDHEDGRERENVPPGW